MNGCRVAVDSIGSVQPDIRERLRKSAQPLIHLSANKFRGEALFQVLAASLRTDPLQQIFPLLLISPVSCSRRIKNGKA